MSRVAISAKIWLGNVNFLMIAIKIMFKSLRILHLQKKKAKRSIINTATIPTFRDLVEKPTEHIQILF